MREIYTSVKDVIKEGAMFPPIGDMDRQARIQEYLNNYDGTYNDDKRLVVVTREGIKVYNHKIITLNYFKLITNKFISMLFNVPPHLTVEDKDIEAQMHSMVKNTNFWGHMQDYGKSFSSTGDASNYVIKSRTYGALVSVFNPAMAMKIPSPLNLDDIQCYILSRPIEVLDDHDPDRVVIRVKFIHFMIHYRGYYKEFVMEYDGKKLGRFVDYKDDYINVPKRGKRVNTGLSDFAISMAHNSRNIGELYGTSDYEDIKSPLYEKEKRMTLGSITIDKNIEGILVVPQGMLRKDPITDRVVFQGEGGIVEKVTDTDDPKYIAPDGKLESNENLIKMLGEEIVILCELTKVILYGDYAPNTSGEAIKSQMKGALDKVSRQIMSLDFPIKRTLCNMMECIGVKISPSDINIQWQDGITESMKEIAETVKALREANVMSLHTILMKYFGLSDEMATKEIELVRQELAYATPASADGQGGASAPSGVNGQEDDNPNIASTTLNGAQVQSLLEVVQSYGQGIISQDAAVTLIVSAFGIDEVQAQKIVGHINSEPNKGGNENGQSTATAD